MVFLGIDVAKKKLDCCLLFDSESTKKKDKTFSNDATGFENILQWLKKQGVIFESCHAVMEGTGVYHEAVALALSDAGLIVSIANPAQTRNFAQGLGIQTKTDKMDSFVLARYATLVRPKAWLPPSQESRILKALIARREAIAQDMQREQNRQEKIAFTVQHKPISQSLENSIDFLQKQLDAIQQELDEHINQHPTLRKDFELLTSIPAVGPQVGKAMLSIMHNHSFQSAEQLASYCGLVPIERESGSSVHGKPRLAKTGPAHIRKVLYMAAIVATKYNPHAKALYERLLLRGKSKMAALGAVMRKLVHLCFGVCNTQMPYQVDYTQP